MPTTRNHAFVGVVNNKIYVIGGRQAAGMIPYSSNTDVVEEYDPATNTWGTRQAADVDAAQRRRLATYNGRIYIGGGEWISRDVMASFRALEAYEPATDTWTLLPALPGTVHGNAMALHRQQAAQRERQDGERRAARSDGRRDRRSQRHGNSCGGAGRTDGDE